MLRSGGWAELGTLSPLHATVNIIIIPLFIFINSIISGIVQRLGYSAFTSSDLKHRKDPGSIPGTGNISFCPLDGLPLLDWRRVHPEQTVVPLMFTFILLLKSSPRSFVKSSAGRSTSNRHVCPDSFDAAQGTIVHTSASPYLHPSNVTWTINKAFCFFLSRSCLRSSTLASQSGLAPHVINSSSPAPDQTSRLAINPRPHKNQYSSKP